MGDRARAVAGAMAGHPKRVLATVLAITALFAFCAKDVRLDNNFAALFATDSEEAQFREEHRRIWGPDDGLLVAIVQTNDAPTPALVELLDRITDETASSIPALDRINSVTNTEVVGRSVDGAAVVGPVFGHRSTAGGSIEDRVRLALSSELGSANLVSEDGRTFVIVGEMKAEYDSYESIVGPAEEFRSKVESIVGQSNLPVTTHFSGVAYTRIAAIQQMQSDLLKLSPVATVIMGLILWVIFRRIAAVAGPVLAIGSSLVVTAGVIGLANDDINQVTIIYPILMMGVVVSSSTHLVHRFYRERAAGRTAEEAGRIVLERVTRAAFVAALTTAIGFASLIVAQMQILHEFGLYLAIGVMAAFLIQCAIVPAVLVWSNSEPSDAYLKAASRGAIGTGTRTEQFARWVVRPKVAPAVLVAGVLLVLGSALIASTAVYDYALSKSLDSSSPVSQGNAVMDGELSGIVPIEISLQGRPGAFRDPDVLDRVERLGRWLRDNYGLRTMDVAQLVKQQSAVLTGVDDVPTDPAVTAQLLDLAAGYNNGAYLDMLVKDDFGQARMRGFTPDHGGRYVIELKQRFEAEARQVLDGSGVTARITGEAPVAYDGMNNLSRELVHSTALALVMVVLAILVVFRNGWLGLIGLLPNAVPVVVGLALYTLSRDVLDPLPGVVFCIAVGLAADDTIHLINRWQELCRERPSAVEALVEAFVTVRKAMVSSSLVLIAGFLALSLSGFPWNRELGILGSFVLLLALGSDLLFGTAGLAVLARRRDARAGDHDASVVDLRRPREKAASLSSVPMRDKIRSVDPV